ncbi:hypothetical protein PISMIDRAFT_670326, partial [Pisolithus microcarpus 441]
MTCQMGLCGAPRPLKLPRRVGLTYFTRVGDKTRSSELSREEKQKRLSITQQCYLSESLSARPTRSPRLTFFSGSVFV